MKQKYLVKGILSLSLIFISSLVFGQNVDQIREIKKENNLSKLEELKNKYQQAQAKEKEKAVEMAKQKGWPLTYTDQNGSYRELMKVTKEGKPIYYKTYNVAAAISTRANWLHNGGGLGLNLEGQGMTAYIWDGGVARGTHQEFDGPGGDNRFTLGDGGGLNFHAAHVTGTVISSGEINTSSKGMAPQASAVGYDWNSDESEATDAAANGMLLSNHSYGYGAEDIPDSWFGAYLADGRNMDVIMYNAPFYLQVSAAGNDGNDNASNASPLGSNPLFDKISGLQTSKNGLVVANGLDASINSSDGTLNSVSRNSGSSEGPMDDLRIKPDIMGNGSGLLSTFHNADDSYDILSGTSMASPNVMGSLLLLQQYYNQLNGTFMRAATLKGLALHTTDDVGQTGPDAQHGWGLMNSKVAAETLTNNGLYSHISEETLAEGETFTMTVRADGTNPLLASISWTDAPGQLSSGLNDPTPALVNDLDIRITQNTDTFTPWMLTSVTTNDKGDNIVDPYERVDVDGATGEYTITVTHKGTLQNGPQRFSLIVTGIESDFTFTADNSNQETCSDSNAVFDFSYVQIMAGTTNFSVQNVPTGATVDFSEPSLNANGNFTLTISGLENVSTGTHELTVVGDNGNETESKIITLRVYHPNFDNDPMSISYPENEFRGVLYPNATLTWDENINAKTYLIEVSESPSFDNLISSGTETDLDFDVSGLEFNMVYYWRIKPSNDCTSGQYSETYSFQTQGPEDCSNTYTATNFDDATIFDSEGNTASVPIDITDNLIINRLIVDVDVTHRSVEDVTLFIQEPASLGSGNTILLDRACDDSDDIFDAIFDDEGGAVNCNTTSPVITGTIAPVQSLASSAGKDAIGRWFFAVTDNILFDGGTIDAASITVCTSSANTSVPDFVGNTIDVAANGSYTVQTTDIEASTASETSDQQLYRLVVLPTKGDIRKNGVALGIGGTFTQEDIDLGNVTFVNIQTETFTDAFNVDITNASGGWLPNQTVNISANTVSAESFELSNLAVYPNPSEGTIFVQFPTIDATSGVKVDLFDLRGRKIYSEDFRADQNTFEESISLGRISNGIYLIKVSHGKFSTTKRVIIQK